tara:strand:+ start:2191 stop:2547 length:357 start_codon:yes stop_codon:yes gene_type:complete
MSVSKSCNSLSSSEVRSELRVDEKGHLTLDGSGEVVDRTGKSPMWRFRERIWKRIDREQHDISMDLYRKQELAVKMVQADVEYMEREKAKTGSYPERSGDPVPSKESLNEYADKVIGD